MFEINRNKNQGGNGEIKLQKPLLIKINFQILSRSGYPLSKLNELLRVWETDGGSHFLNLSTDFIYSDVGNITILSILSMVHGQRSVHWITATQG